MPAENKGYPLPLNRADLFDSFRPKNVDNDSYILVSGNGNPQLSEDVAELLGQDITFPCAEFPNGETSVKIEPNLRGRNVFVLQSMYPNPNQGLQEAVLIGDTISRSHGGNAALFMSKMGYDRQDRRAESRTPISVAAAADQLKNAGMYSSLLTVDIHAEQSMASFRAWDNVYGSKVLVPAIEKLGLEDIVVLAPDAGSAKRAEKYADKLGNADVAVVFKKRSTSSESRVLHLAGDVRDKDVVIVDDVVATGGSLINAAQKAKDMGARTVIAAVTHSELVPDSKGRTLLDRLDESGCPLDRFITTDTIFQSEDVRRPDNIDVVSVAPILAVAILCYLTGESLGKRLIN